MLFQPSSLLQSDKILFNLFTLTLPKMPDKLKPSKKMPVKDIVLNHGVQVELLPEFQELLVQVLTDLVKPLSVT